MNQEILKEYIAYDPVTGIFTRIKKSSNRNKLGQIQIPKSCVYGKITLCKTNYLLHRLAWLYMTGEWPSKDIDHTNRDKHDNRWENLRLTTTRANIINSARCGSGNKAGLLCACPNSRGGYTSEIKINGKRIRLGTFKTAIEAHNAYMAMLTW